MITRQWASPPHLLFSPSLSKFEILSFSCRSILLEARAGAGVDARGRFLPLHLLATSTTSQQRAMAATVGLLLASLRSHRANSRPWRPLFVQRQRALLWAVSWAVSGRMQVLRSWEPSSLSNPDSASSSLASYIPACPKHHLLRQPSSSFTSPRPPYWIRSDLVGSIATIHWI